MMAACPAFDPLGPYVSNVLAWADCRMLMLGANGYAALGPSSSYGMAWTGLLTILVALFGYRLLLTGAFALRDVMVMILKLGAVLALAGQWPAYRALVFDVFTTAPTELTVSLLAQSSLATSGTHGMAARVDGVNAAIADMIPPPATAPAAASPAREGGAPPPPAAATPPGTLSEKAQHNGERASGLLTVSALGGLLSVRVVSGVLLGLGPLFVACLLFPATQGLFIGWLRGLIGAGLGSVVVSLALAMELAIIEPQVIALRDLVESGQDAGTLPAAIFATAAFFAVLMLVTLGAVAKVATGLRLSARAAAVSVADQWERSFTSSAPPLRTAPPAGTMAASAAPVAPSRTRAVADAFKALDRREGGATVDQIRLMRVTEAVPAAAGHGPTSTALPLGQSGRRTGPRKSATADRRDELK